MATPRKPQPDGFPVLKWEQEEMATRPMPLHELPHQAGVDRALDVIAARHERIANGIKAFWGTSDCVDYMEKLIMSGGDGLGHTRVGFKPEVVTALMSLISLHQNERK